MFERTTCLTTSDFTSALRSYSPQTSSASHFGTAHSAARRTTFTQLRATSAQQRRAYISFIVSRERAKRAQLEGLKCYSVDALTLPRAKTSIAYAPASSTSLSLSNKNNNSNSGSARKPRFIFSHSSPAGNNLEKEQREREHRLRDDSSSVLPPAGGGGGTSTAKHSSSSNGTAAAAAAVAASYTNGFRPMNSRNNFLGGQQIAPVVTSQAPAAGGSGVGRAVNSSNTSSSYSEYTCRSRLLVIRGSYMCQCVLCGVVSYIAIRYLLLTHLLLAMVLSRLSRVIKSSMVSVLDTGMPTT